MSEEEKKVEEVKEEAAPAQETADVMASVMHSPDDPVVSAKTLLDAGCHFGHRVSRWNPKMRPYIYGKRNNLHIIDLNKSAQMMQTSYLALKDIVSKGGKVLFVGTKKLASKVIQEEAVRSGSFYVSHRWLGGTLTNFRTICKRIALLKEIEQKESLGELDKLTKKEISEQLKLKEKLSSNLEGIKEIRYLPNALVVVDPKAEHNAIAEAKILNIPIFALGDTNTDPDEIDYLIPANDDSESSIRIIIGLLADAVVEGKGGDPIYAYKGNTEVTGSMGEIMKTLDSSEQFKLIRAKLRNDSIAMRKPGSKSRRKAPKKEFHHFNKKDNNAAKEGEKSEASAATPATTAETIEAKTAEETK